MTLFKGCHVVKCDESGKPAENEVYVQYEVVNLSPGFIDYTQPESPDRTEQVFVLLKKVR
jgi:hypothetical protein